MCKGREKTMENKNTYLLVFFSYLSVKIIIICDNINNAFSLILQHIFSQNIIINYLTAC